LVEGVEELAPYPTPFAQHRTPGGREAIEAATALPGLFNPTALDPPSLFGLVEQRVERGGWESQSVFRAFGDELGDLIAVPGGPSRTARTRNSALPF
jgi:hypothetical protein